MCPGNIRFLMIVLHIYFDLHVSGTVPLRNVPPPDLVPAYVTFRYRIVGAERRLRLSRSAAIAPHHIQLSTYETVSLPEPREEIRRILVASLDPLHRQSRGFWVPCKEQAQRNIGDRRCRRPCQYRIFAQTGALEPPSRQKSQKKPACAAGQRREAVRHPMIAFLTTSERRVGKPHWP